MSLDKNEVLSQIDPDNPDLSNLPIAPSDIFIDGDEIVVSKQDGSTEVLGKVNIPVEKTIVNAQLNGDGHLIVQYSDDTFEDLGKIKGVREDVYATSGVGVMANQNGFDLTFEALPINSSLALSKGKLSPRTDRLRYHDYSKFLAIYTSGAAGRRVLGLNYVSALNYAQVNNLALSLHRGIVTLPAGKYYVRGQLTSHRYFHNIPRIVSLPDPNNIDNWVMLLSGVMSLTFASALSTDTGEVAGIVELVEETHIALLTYSGDNRITYNQHHAGVGFSANSSIQYSTSASLEIWRLN